MGTEILIKSYINESMWSELYDALCFARARLIKDIDLHSDLIDVDYYSEIVSKLDVLSFFMRASISYNTTENVSVADKNTQ